MPKENNFEHSKYSRSDPAERVDYRTLEPGAVPHSPAWKEELALAGETLMREGVRAILLVYGCYFGSDLFGSARLDEAGGLKRGYSRGIPGLETLLGALRSGPHLQPLEGQGFSPPYTNDELTKVQLDAHAGEIGNFSGEYIETLREALTRSGSLPLTCSRYLWSSVHHHLGRMEAALALFHELQALKKTLSLDSGHRVLVVAHGHAGQVLALLSNLIVPGESTVRLMIFNTLAEYYEQTNPASVSFSFLQDLDQFLSTEESQKSPALDIVTLGTPVRYGWDTSGIGRLLHFVNHRPIRNDGKRWLAKMELPQVAWEVPTATGGDYVQQLAVAGTDALPTSSIEQDVNHALREFLEPYDGFERWLECVRRATRCPNDGYCLLVDYQDAGDSSPSDHLFGHACYTRKTTMLFQIREIVNTLYSPPQSSL